MVAGGCVQSFSEVGQVASSTLVRSTKSNTSPFSSLNELNYFLV